MKINKKDFEKVMEKAETTIKSPKITEPQKYMYCDQKIQEHAESMKKYPGKSKEYMQSIRNMLMWWCERNKFCKINKRELIMVITLLKLYNASSDNKIFIDEKGRRVKRYDRRAIRIDAFRE